jgi:hypothetical protein
MVRSTFWQPFQPASAGRLTFSEAQDRQYNNTEPKSRKEARTNEEIVLWDQGSVEPKHPQSICIPRMTTRHKR